MITPLRKTHLRIWIAWAILLPTLYMYALWNIPKFEKNELIFKDLPKALPVELRTIKDNQLQITLRKDERENYQIELQLLEPFKAVAPSLWVNIHQKASIENGEFLGNLEGKGLYRFAVKPEIAKELKEIIFYCAIKKQAIKRILFVTH